MDLKLIQKLIRMMRSGGVGELEIEDPSSGLKLRLKREGESAPQPAPLVQLMHAAAPAPVPAPVATPGLEAPAAAAAAPPPAAPGEAITSPMVGTFYRASSPDTEPFVQVGSRVEVDAPLCIIEAMKVMNEIKSEVAGEILEILVENGEPVEFGQPLFLVKLA
jgi:acetyl-CoA carboxylase biotin carboxyl carrier protein